MSNPRSSMIQPVQSAKPDVSADVSEADMARSYASFVVRCWQVSGGEQRFVIQHVQSGKRTRALSSSEALAWMMAHCEFDEHKTATPVARSGPRRRARSA